MASRRLRWLRRRWSGGIFAAGALWLAWPWLRPVLWPARGAPLLVVLDGYHRLDHALLLQQHSGWPILLITCPATGQPTASQRARATAPLLVLSAGIDTADQAVVLRHWLEQRLPYQPFPAVIGLVSDRHHFPRAALAAQIAMGARGSRVQPITAAVVSPSPALWRTSLRDALRLQLWRATGSTGAEWVPAQRASKQQRCFPLQPKS